MAKKKIFSDDYRRLSVQLQNSRDFYFEFNEFMSNLAVYDFLDSELHDIHEELGDILVLLHSIFMKRQHDFTNFVFEEKDHE